MSHLAARAVLALLAVSGCGRAALAASAGGWNGGSTFSGARIELEVLDDSGAPVTYGDAFCDQGASPPVAFPSARRRAAPKRVRPGVYQFSVASGRAYTIGWRGPEHATVAERMLAARAGVTKRILRLGPRLEPAKLVVRVRPEGGRTFEEALFGWETGVVVDCLRTGARITSQVRDGFYDLAAGDYEVRAGPRLWTPFICSWGAAPPSHGVARATVHLAPGEERRLVLRPPRGSQLRLALTLPPGTSDPLLRAILDDPGDWGPCNDALNEGRGVRVTVDGGTEPLFFYYGDDPADASILDVILPGTTATSLRVHEPGLHTFRVDGDGFEAAKATVWMNVGGPVELSIPLRELR